MRKFICFFMIKSVLTIPYVFDKFLAFFYKACMKHCGKVFTFVRCQVISRDWRIFQWVITQVFLKVACSIARKLH